MVVEQARLAITTGPVDRRGVHPQDPNTLDRMLSDELADQNADTELFPDLPLHGLSLRLPRFHATAGHLPTPGDFQRTGATREQEPAVPGDRGRDDHRLINHHDALPLALPMLKKSVTLPE